MIQKYITLVCLVSGLSATPALAQVMSIDTTIRSTTRDQQGNVVSSQFNFKMWTNESGPQSKLDQIQSQKIAFFTNEIGLTASEAERFWPMYNELFQKREAFNTQKNKLLRQLSSEATIAAISEKELKALLDSYLICIERDAELQMEYYKKFATILPAKKVARFYIAEQLFIQILLQNMIRNRY
jgi:hypothetical protein